MDNQVLLINHGGYDGNVYLFGVKGGPCLIIDVGSSRFDKIMDLVKTRHSKIEGVLLTHGHFDHIMGIEQIPDDIPVFMGEEDIPSLEDPKFNLSFDLLGESLSFKTPKGIYPVEDEDEIVTESFAFKVIHTPFHTEGSVCFLFPKEKIMFTGDTLFARGIGRTDLKGGRSSLIESSLEKLEALDPTIRIYPGHYGSSNLGEALRFAKMVI